MHGTACCSLAQYILDLRDIKWQLFLFRHRESRLLMKLATTIGSTRGELQFHAWNNNLDLVIAVSR